LIQKGNRMGSVAYQLGLRNFSRVVRVGYELHIFNKAYWGKTLCMRMKAKLLEF
jgi:hypothetical protein